MTNLTQKLTAAVLFAVMAITGSAVVSAANEMMGSPAADISANMEKMQEQMSAYSASKDPKERARLMDEHMKTMQSTLPMMQQQGGCMMMGKGAMGMGKMANKENGSHMMNSDESAEGSNMMQMMMGQMMQHQQAMQNAEK